MFKIILCVHKVSIPGAVYWNKTVFNGKIYWNRYSKCWAIFQHIHLRNWDICHNVGTTCVSLYLRSLMRGIATSLSQNSVHIAFRAYLVPFNFVLQGDPLWRKCIACCLVSGVICVTYVSSFVMIRSTNSSPSTRHRCRNGNADSMHFAMCSGVSSYAPCIQNFITDYISQSSGVGIRASIFNSCNDENSGSPASACVMRLITLSRSRSHFTQ